MTRYEWLKEIALIKTEECIPFPGGTNKKGYGWLSIPGTRTPKLAHRVVWEILYGPIPEGFQICHHCDNPCCVNKDHLWMGTNAENTQDKVDKGRQAKKLTNQELEDIQELYEQGVSFMKIARQFGVTPMAIHRIIRRTW